MKNPLDEPPGLTVNQKNGDKILIKTIMESTLECLQDGLRYDMKIVITRRARKQNEPT